MVPHALNLIVQYFHTTVLENEVRLNKFFSNFDHIQIFIYMSQLYYTPIYTQTFKQKKISIFWEISMQRSTSCINNTKTYTPHMTSKFLYVQYWIFGLFVFYYFKQNGEVRFNIMIIVFSSRVGWMGLGIVKKKHELD